MRQPLALLLALCLAAPASAANLAAAAAARAATSVRGALGVAVVPSLGQMPLGGTLKAAQTPVLDAGGLFLGAEQAKLSKLLSVAPSAQAAGASGGVTLAAPTESLALPNAAAVAQRVATARAEPLRVDGGRGGVPHQEGDFWRASSVKGKGDKRSDGQRRHDSVRAVLESLAHELEGLNIDEIDPQTADVIMARVWTGIRKRERLASQRGAGRTAFLDSALRLKLGADQERERIQMLKRLIYFAEPESLAAAVRVKPDGLFGRGDEAVVFEMAPTAELLLNAGFRQAVTNELKSQPALRARLAEASAGRASADDPRALVDFLPPSLVVKIIQPHDGVWESDWGRRPFDAPLYARQELEDGSILIVQEKLQVSPEAMTALQAQLPDGYAVIDRANREQAGFDAAGRAMLIDYGAVGRAYELSGARAQATNAAQAAQEFDDFDAAREDALDRQAESDRMSFEEDGARLQAIKDAILGQGRGAELDGGDRAILKVIADSAGALDHVAADVREDAVVMWAAQRKPGEFDYEAAEFEVDRVVLWAVENGLFLR